jgi:predicted signal transduction protein with EAL and GGDEF domain
VLLGGLQPEVARQVAPRLLQVLDEPLALAGATVPVRARSGMAVGRRAPGSATPDARELLRRAESAARGATPGRPPHVDTGAAAPAAGDSAHDEADLARGLAAAGAVRPLPAARRHLDGRIRSSRRSCAGATPSAGWCRRTGFIGLAERTGLIVPLGLHVLTLACASCAPGRPRAGPQRAVNVSARSSRGRLRRRRTRVLQDSAVDPGRVVLELTESLLVDDSEAAVEVLVALRAWAFPSPSTTSAPATPRSPVSAASRSTR